MSDLSIDLQEPRLRQRMHAPLLQKLHREEHTNWVSINHFHTHCLWITFSYKDFIGNPKMWSVQDRNLELFWEIVHFSKSFSLFSNYLFFIGRKNSAHNVGKRLEQRELYIVILTLCILVIIYGFCFLI